MTPVDFFLDSLIIILPLFAAVVIACLPWTDQEIDQTYRFWVRHTINPITAARALASRRGRGSHLIRRHVQKQPVIIIDYDRS